MNNTPKGTLGHVLGGVVAGVVVATIGTVSHRAVLGDAAVPYGLVLSSVVVLLVGVCMRAWGGFHAMSGVGVGLVIAVAVLTLIRPGDDILIAADPKGIAWLCGVAVALPAAAFAPRSWFSEVPVRPSRLVASGSNHVESGPE